LALMAMFLLALSNGYAQHLQYHMLDEKDGLPGTKIVDIEQDDDGFMWFLCGSRALRFDGADFKSYELKMPGASVLSKDYFGRIWFHGRSKYLRYYDKGSIHEYEYNHLLDKYAGAGIKSIYLARDRSLWIGLVSQQAIKTPCFLHIDTTGTVHEVQRPDEKSNWLIRELGDTFLQAVKYIDKYTIDSLHLRIDNKEGYKQYVVPNYLERHVYRIQGEYVMVSRYQGIYAIGSKSEFYSKLTGLRFLDAFANQRGQVFIPREIGGVLHFSTSDFNGDQQMFFETKHISSVYQSNDQSSWFGAFTGEVYYVPALAARVFDPGIGLPHGRIVNAFRETNNLWLVYKEGIVSTVTLGQNQVKSYDFKTLIQNLHLFPEHKKIMLSTPYPFKEPDNFNYSISFKGSMRKGAFFSENDFYFGGGRAIHEWSLADDSLLRTHRLKEKTIDQYRISEKHYLFSDTKGLHSFKEGEITSFSESFEVLEGRVNEIIALGNNWFVVNSASNGLVILKYVNGIQICYPLHIAKGVPIQKVVLRQPGDLWAASTLGVYQLAYTIAGDTVHVEKRQYIGLKDGFTNQALTELLIDSEYVWLATTESVTRLPINAKRKVVKPRQVSILQMTLGEEFVDVNGRNHLLYASEPATIHFSSPDFNHPQGLQYRGRLIGKDTAWTTTKERSMQFNSLAPGAYEFQVMALNKHGAISKATLFPFVIEPRYWQTTVFKAATFVVGLLFLGLFGYLRMQRVRQRQHLITEIKSYRNKTLRLQMNPHFMYNTLGSIQSFVLQEESRLSSRYIAKFSRLMRVIFEHNTKELITLSEELEALKLYIELESLRRKDQLDFELDIASSLDIHKTLIPPMLLQPLVENSIQHGLTGRAKNLISVRIISEKGGLKFFVRDNGAWNSSNEKKEKRVSGGVITSDRIALFNQQRRYKGTMNMEQLEGVGTQVTFSIAHLTTN